MKFKFLFFFLFLNLQANAISQPEIVEIASWKFLPHVQLGLQQKSVEDFNIFLKKIEGFRSRHVYYSEKNQKWTEVIVWANQAAANEAVRKSEDDPDYKKILPLIDIRTLLVDHYTKSLEFKK